MPTKSAIPLFIKRFVPACHAGGRGFKSRRSRHYQVADKTKIIVRSGYGTKSKVQTPRASESLKNSDSGAGFVRAGRAVEKWSAALSGIAVALASFGAIALAPWPVMIVDGDTVDRMGLRYRLVGYDAPEIRRAKCDRERNQALAAKARLAELVASAQRVELIRTSWKLDPWGRALARLEIDGQDVSAIAQREGWGVSYSGRGARRDWCAYSSPFGCAAHPLARPSRSPEECTNGRTRHGCRWPTFPPASLLAWGSGR